MKIIEQAQEEFKDYIPSGVGHVSLVGYVYETDGLIVATNRACHASMSGPPRATGYGRLVLPKDGGEEEEEYYDEDEQYEDEEEDEDDL